MVLSLTACGGQTEQGAQQNSAPNDTQLEQQTERVIEYGIAGAWDSLMPYGSISASNYARIVYDKLYDRPVFIHADGTLSPRAASAWESIDDGYAIRFTLNENARFHDGTPVTSEHWAQTFSIITNPNCAILGRSNYAVISGTDEGGNLIDGEQLGVTVEDDYHFVLHFKKATTAEDFLLEYGRELYVLPTHLLSDIADEDLVSDEFWRAPIGSGPCVFVSEEPGSSITLTAFEDYYQGNDGYDRLHIRVVDKSNHLTALLSGDLDYYAFGNAVTGENISFAEENGLTVVKSESYNNFYELMFNNESLSDENLRKAISLSIDRARLADYTAGDLGTVASDYLLPDSTWRSYTAASEQDLDLARSYLDAAQYDGETLTLATTSARSGLAALLEQDLSAIGVQLELVTVDSASLFSGMTAGSYDLAIASHTPSALPLWFVESRFTADGGVFRSFDSRYRSDIAAVQTAMEPSERLAAMETLLQYLDEQTPFVPLFFTKLAYVESPTLSSVEYTASSFSNENIWDWVKQ